jgi:hypothetical protein
MIFKIKLQSVANYWMQSNCRDRKTSMFYGQSMDWLEYWSSIVFGVCLDHLSWLLYQRVKQLLSAQQ